MKNYKDMGRKYTKEEIENAEEWFDEGCVSECIICEGDFVPGNDGNELGFCLKCQKQQDFHYNLDKYYEDHDRGKVAFKGIETIDKEFDEIKNL